MNRYTIAAAVIGIIFVSVTYTAYTVWEFCAGVLHGARSELRDRRMPDQGAVDQWRFVAIEGLRSFWGLKSRARAERVLDSLGVDPFAYTTEQAYLKEVIQRSATKGKP
jgi:hypothetical protein